MACWRATWKLPTANPRKSRATRCASRATASRRAPSRWRARRSCACCWEAFARCSKAAWRRSAEDFEVTLEEQATHWTLTLTPREPRLAKHLERIEVFGSGDRPGCVEALEPDGDGALTLLADSMRAAAPEHGSHLARRTRTPLPRARSSAEPCSNDPPRRAAAGRLVWPAGVGFRLESTRDWSVSADLRLFMPAPRTEEQKLLVQNIGESPASRLLLVAIGGDEPGGARRGLEETRRRTERQRRIRPGRQWRTDAARHSRRTAAVSLPAHRLLRRATARPAATGGRARGSSRRHGLAGSRLSRRMAAARSHAGGAAPRRALAAAFRAAAHRRCVVHRGRPARACCWRKRAPRLSIPMARRAPWTRCAPSSRVPAARRRPRSRSAARDTSRQSSRNARRPKPAWFGGAATLGMILLMWFAYRHAGFTLLGALPLVSAALAGLVGGQRAVRQRARHHAGVRLHAHRRGAGLSASTCSVISRPASPRCRPRARCGARSPPGVASTCIAYLAFLESGVTGLAQLACLTVTGLIVAGLTTRFLLPHIVPAPRRDPAAFSAAGRESMNASRACRGPCGCSALIPLVAAAVFLCAPPGSGRTICRS